MNKQHTQSIRNIREAKEFINQLKTQIQAFPTKIVYFLHY